MRTGSSAASRTGWQTSEDRTIGDPDPDARSPGLAGFCTREAPIEPQSIARHVRSAEATQPGRQRPLRRPQLVSVAVAWLTVSDVAKQLRVSSATVYRLIDSGELRHGRVSNAIRISQADLAAFLHGTHEPRGDACLGVLCSDRPLAPESALPRHYCWSAQVRSDQLALLLAA